MKCAFAVCLVAFGLIGCASSHVIVGTPRAAITPAEVRLYTTPPPNYEEIALLDASSQSSFAIGDQMKVDVVIRRLKEEAAALGANGILLQGVGSQSAGAVGTGTATEVAALFWTRNRVCVSGRTALS